MYCSNCGTRIDDKAVICPFCGCQQKPVQNYTNVPKDDGNVGWAILGFFLPVIGLILYLVWKDSQPRNAVSAGKGALIAVVLEVAIPVIAFLFGVSILGGILSAV